jgi:hypothetical protein
MTASDSTTLRFEPPGPGSWEQDPVHFPRPMTRYFQETHITVVETGPFIEDARRCLKEDEREEFIGYIARRLVHRAQQ